METESQRLAVEPLVLGGRTFRLAKSYSFGNDLYISRELSATGLVEAFQTLASSPELDRNRALQVVAAFTSGRLCNFLAGILHEDGVKWSEDNAKANSQFFFDIEDDAEKTAMLSTLTIRIASFFLNGLGSTQTSPKSLPSEEVPEAAGPPTVAV